MPSEAPSQIWIPGQTPICRLSSCQQRRVLFWTCEVCRKFLLLRAERRWYWRFSHRHRRSFRHMYSRHPWNSSWFCWRFRRKQEEKREIRPRHAAKILLQVFIQWVLQKTILYFYYIRIGGKSQYKLWTNHENLFRQKIIFSYKLYSLKHFVKNFKISVANTVKLWYSI